MFVLADEAKVPLVPTTIIGSNDIMPRGKFQIKSGNVKVVFSDPLDYRREKNFLEEIRLEIDKSLIG
jgi:1-acyl-sn-glycerol-3-phosphate acyltransferase